MVATEAMSRSTPAPKARVWCPICAIHVNLGDPLPCYKVGVEWDFENCGCHGRTTEAFEEPAPRINLDQRKAQQQLETIQVFEAALAQDRKDAEETYGYPDDNPKTAVGIHKASVDGVPPVAFFALGEAFADGVRKYGRFNWRDKSITASVYYNAAMRHLASWWDGEENAQDSGVHHIAHAMACMAMILDAKEQGMIKDDRGTAGKLPEFLTRLANVKEKFRS